MGGTLILKRALHSRMQRSARPLRERAADEPQGR